MNKQKIYALAVAGLIAFSAQAGNIDTAKRFSVTNALGNNMVVQQGKPLKIWGKAPAGDVIELNADWGKSAKTTAGADGKWLAEIKVPSAKRGDFKPHTITIIHKKASGSNIVTDNLRFTNVLIGDVWFASGQSNMELRIAAVPGWSSGIKDFEKEVPLTNYPNIRLFKSDMGIDFTPQDTIKGGKWEVCSPKTAAGFSAVAYFFGRELYNKRQIPIGLVDQAIPATAAQNFTDINVLLADSILKKKYVDPYAKAVDSIKAKNDKATTLASLTYPGLVYNKMICPFQDLSVKGFIWYQGESNNLDSTLYTHLSTAMLQSWRKDFEQGDLPFYFVQMTPYKWNNNDSTANWYAKFREAQEAILKVKNTGMAVTMDIGEPDNIHPLNKKDVGVRLGKIALAKTYGEDVIYEGPHFKSFKVYGSSVTVQFVKSSIAGGLKTNDRMAPKYFYLAGADKRFYKADAKIVNNQIVLTSQQVQKPVAVRYAFTNFPVTNLSNGAGLPAVPFRTDNWTN
ncbi:sialate O-acetylesterase [Mucilaginibacter limnophilus]|uniref:Sialate O-acetylesterase n=1 Tax=Mucilaginibacter limnophilus TaxID=1932778 RepID=A0A3S2WZT4_9SPHI|nr:sialate O-acetylesterase [Mucilaginibacter limnophilus]RVU02037.1 sialate O-acetylesterase [Mucilaginibacter limnophilus]